MTQYPTAEMIEALRESRRMLSCTEREIERLRIQGGLQPKKTAGIYKTIAQIDEAMRAKEQSHSPTEATETGAEIKTFHGRATSLCPICGKSGPHNHSLLEVEAYHRAKDNEARNFGLVTFETSEIVEMVRTRAKGLNDRRQRP